MKQLPNLIWSSINVYFEFPVLFLTNQLIHGNVSFICSKIQIQMPAPSKSFAV